MTQTVKRSGSHGWRNRNKDPEEGVGAHVIDCDVLLMG